MLFGIIRGVPKETGIQTKGDFKLGKFKLGKFVYFTDEYKRYSQKMTSY